MCPLYILVNLEERLLEWRYVSCCLIALNQQLWHQQKPFYFKPTAHSILPPWLYQHFMMESQSLQTAVLMLVLLIRGLHEEQMLHSLNNFRYQQPRDISQILLFYLTLILQKYKVELILHKIRVVGVKDGHDLMPKQKSFTNVFKKDFIRSLVPILSASRWQMLRVHRKTFTGK